MAGDKNDNFDRAEIELVCYEGSKDLFADDDADQNHQTSVVSFTNGGSDHHGVSLPSLSEECIDWMVEREKEHMPRDDYVERLRNGELDLTLRKDSIDWIIQACAHHNFGELCLYSATSYFDRFLSEHEFSQEKNHMVWATQLAAVACLSLAAKMQEINVPVLVDLQAGEPRCIFQGKTIHRMEILISNVLKWRLNPYTPFNYIGFYLRKMSDGELPPQHVIAKSIGIILTTIEDIKFLEYKPSEIAASVAVYALRGPQEIDISETWAGDLGVEKGRVMKCLELIQGFGSSMSETDSTITREDVANPRVGSPNRVLDIAPCFSLSDQITTTTVESEGASPEYKRMKLNNSPTPEK